MDLQSSLTHYLEDVTGQTPLIRPLPKHAHAGLPVYLVHSYNLYELQLFEEALILAMVKESEDDIDLTQLGKDQEKFAQTLCRAVVLVLPQIRSYERKRLVERKVPFIVPGRQMFLPMLLVDFRETYPIKTNRPSTHLGWVAQVIILRHLLMGDISDRPLTDVASLLGYSKMAITQGLNQMLPLELCHEVSAGRSKMIEFVHPADYLWRKAQPFLRSPVKRRYFVKWLDAPDARLPYAGLSALANLTSMAPGAKDVFSMHDRSIRRMLAEGKCLASPLEEDAQFILEGWAYHPDLLAFEDTVDPISLYLSMQKESDERVHMALDQLMERWS